MVIIATVLNVSMGTHGRVRHNSVSFPSLARQRKAPMWVWLGVAMVSWLTMSEDSLNTSTTASGKTWEEDINLF